MFILEQTCIGLVVFLFTNALLSHAQSLESHTKAVEEVSNVTLPLFNYYLARTDLEIIPIVLKANMDIEQNLHFIKTANSVQGVVGIINLTRANMLAQLSTKFYPPSRILDALEGKAALHSNDQLIEDSLELLKLVASAQYN